MNQIRKFINDVYTKEEIKTISNKIKNTKISFSLKKNIKFKKNSFQSKYILTCLECNEKFEAFNKNKKCCSRKCANVYVNRIRGKLSVKSQNKRDQG